MFIPMKTIKADCIKIYNALMEKGFRTSEEFHNAYQDEIVALAELYNCRGKKEFRLQKGDKIDVVWCL